LNYGPELWICKVVLQRAVEEPSPRVTRVLQHALWLRRSSPRWQVRGAVLGLRRSLRQQALSSALRNFHLNAYISSGRWSTMRHLFSCFTKSPLGSESRLLLRIARRFGQL